MSSYHLHLLHGEMISRSGAEAAWDEADRIEAPALHEGVLDALRKIGLLVDIGVSRAPIGVHRWTKKQRRKNH